MRHQTDESESLWERNISHRQFLLCTWVIFWRSHWSEECWWCCQVQFVTLQTGFQTSLSSSLCCGSVSLSLYSRLYFLSFSQIPANLFHKSQHTTTWTQIWSVLSVWAAVVQTFPHLLMFTWNSSKWEDTLNQIKPDIMNREQKQQWWCQRHQLKLAC